MKKEVIVMTIEEGNNRAFPFIRDILAFDALVISSLGPRRGYKPNEDRGASSKVCQAAGFEMMASVNGYIEAIDTGTFASTIDFEIIDLPSPKNGLIAGLQSMASRTEAAIFTLFVEQAAGWIKRNRTTDYHRWPPVANFCRVVRNAVVHGGRINISSQTAPVVKWRGVTISYQDDGQELFVPSRVSPGDLVILMLELDGELSALGAPFNLA